MKIRTSASIIIISIAIFSALSFFYPTCRGSFCYLETLFPAICISLPLLIAGILLLFSTGGAIIVSIWEIYAVLIYFGILKKIAEYFEIPGLIGGYFDPRYPYLFFGLVGVGILYGLIEGTIKLIRFYKIKKIK